MQRLLQGIARHTDLIWLLGASYVRFITQLVVGML